MVVKAFDYDSHGAPSSWAKVVAMRHALSKYPDCKFIWYLDQNAIIMDLSKSLEAQVLEPKTLESLMIKDYPVVPPDSIIKTFSHLQGQDSNLIVTQDKDSLVHASVILRNGEWAKFFLETWYDPLYRSYNFQRAERHALARLPRDSWRVRRLTGNRSTSCSGTRPFFRGLPSCRSGHLPRTPRRRSAMPTKREISSSYFPTASRRGPRAANAS